jgi:O-antigen/teichoic acid export membrane protein
MTLKRQFVWSMAPLIGVTAINIVSVPFFYRYLGADQYAIWLYVSTFSQTFGFADLGLGVAVGRYIGVALGSGDTHAVKEYWGTGNLIAIPLLAVMSGIFIVLGMWFGPKWFNVAPGDQALLRACFIPGGLALFFSYYGQVWNILLQAHLDFKLSSVLRMATPALQLIPSIALAYLTRSPLPVILWGAVIGLVQLLVFVYYSRRHYQLGFNLSDARWVRAREMAMYTAKTFIMLLIGSVLYQIDRVLLGRLAPSSRFTEYNIAANVGTRFQSLAGSVMGPVFHNTSRAVGGRLPIAAGQIYNETFVFVFEWCVLAVTWAAIWHPVFLRAWLGEELGSKVSPLFTPLIAAFCLNALANISGSQLGALNRLGWSLAFTVAAGALAVAGVFLGWRQAGLVGAAYGFLISRVAFVAQDLYVIRLVKGAGWLSWQPWREIAGQGLVGGLLALSYLVLPRQSFWLLLPGFLHALIVGAWLLRNPLKKLLAGANFAGATPAVSAPPSPDP